MRFAQQTGPIVRDTVDDDGTAAVVAVTEVADGPHTRFPGTIPPCPDQEVQPAVCSFRTHAHAAPLPRLE